MDRRRAQPDRCHQSLHKFQLQHYPGRRPRPAALSGPDAAERVDNTIQLQVFTTFNTLSLSPTLSLLSCHPRLLFWTEIGNVVKIERAGMDGSDRQVVVNSSLGWPGAVTVDTVSNRIYWTDERLKAIGSATLDGNELQVRVGPRPTLGLEASGGLTWSCALRSCRSKRRPTPSHWLYSTKTCSGRTPRDEWCSLLTRPLGRTPRFF